MEQSCYRCGVKFEEGLAFCPQCNAPQIRVMTEPGSALPGPLESTSSFSHYPPVARSGAIDWPKALAAVALANLIAGILLVLLLGLSLGLSVLGGGFLAVAFYRWRTPLAQISAGLGVRLGTLSGAFAFGILAAALGVGAAVLHSWERVQHNVLEMVREASSRNPYPVPPEVMEFLQTPGGFVAFLFVTLVAFLVFGILGGAIGGAILGRRKPPEIGRF